MPDRPCRKPRIRIIIRNATVEIDAVDLAVRVGNILSDLELPYFSKAEVDHVFIHYNARAVVRPMRQRRTKDLHTIDERIAGISEPENSERPDPMLRLIDESDIEVGCVWKLWMKVKSEHAGLMP